MGAILGKDLLRELRSREVLLASFLFSLIALTVFHFAAAAARMPQEHIPLTAWWICVLFAGTLGLNRTHASELHNDCFRALMLGPLDAGWLYLTKAASHFLLLGLTLMLLLPVLVLFFQFWPAGNWPALVGSMLLGVLGFVAIGTLVVGVTGNTRMSDVLFPVVQLPLTVPIILAGSQASQLCLEGKTPWQWWQFLAALDLVYLSVGFLVYEFLLEE